MFKKKLCKEPNNKRLFDEEYTSDAGTLSSRFVPVFMAPCHLLEALNGKAAVLQRTYWLILELAQAAGPPPFPVLRRIKRNPEHWAEDPGHGRFDSNILLIQ